MAHFLGKKVILTGPNGMASHKISPQSRGIPRWVSNVLLLLLDSGVCILHTDVLDKTVIYHWTPKRHRPSLHRNALLRTSQPIGFLKKGLVVGRKMTRATCESHGAPWMPSLHGKVSWEAGPVPGRYDSSVTEGHKNTQRDFFSLPTRDDLCLQVGYGEKGRGRRHGIQDWTILSMPLPVGLPHWTITFFMIVPPVGLRLLVTLLQIYQHRIQAKVAPSLLMNIF